MTTSKKKKKPIGDFSNIPTEVVEALNVIKNRDVSNELPIEINNQSNIVIKNIENKVERVPFFKGDIEYEHSTIAWDFKKTDEVPFFDVRLSYQHTGYKPINKYEGLDFDPTWFTVDRDNKIRTGRYCSYPSKTKAYADYWNEQLRRCIHGLKINGYKITGDHYFFLNFYLLPISKDGEKAGSGRPDGYPDFYVSQYEYFHYIELCRVLGYEAVGLKARGVGFSEIGASFAACTYTTRPSSNVVIAAQKENYVTKTLEKCWKQLDNLNTNTEGGFRRSRAISNNLQRKSGILNKKGEIVGGWLSSVLGIVADTPNKIRGDRVDFLFYEESGSWPDWERAWIQGEALVFVSGRRVGIRLGWGTGGDKGPALAGISKAYYSPNKFQVLPFRHNYTSDGSDVLTSFFLPAYKQVVGPKIKAIDNRGWTNPEIGKKYYLDMFSNLIDDPDLLMIRRAEYCFTAEEALALEGKNFFNKILLGEQMLQIKLGQSPKIQKGTMDFRYPGGDHTQKPFDGKFIPHPDGKVLILEEPLRGEKGEPYANLYIAGIDSIDMGQKDTSTATKDPSEFCITIKKRAMGLSPGYYVAVYKDRPNDVREAYKIALALLMYYNARAVLEYTKISFKEYLQDKRQLFRLMRRTQATMKTPNPNVKTLGVPATTDVIEHYLQLIANHIEDCNHLMWFENMLLELTTYSFENKGKFDIVAAMGMCELADEELREAVPVIKNTDPAADFVDLGYYTDENGYKRYGELPKQKKIAYEWHERYKGPRTSDTRVVEEYFRSQLSPSDRY